MRTRHGLRKQAVFLGLALVAFLNSAHGQSGGGGPDPILAGLQLVTILCEDDHDQCTTVALFLRRESGRPADRVAEHIGNASSSDELFVFPLETTGRENGQYTLLAVGCDERLNFNLEPTLDQEACGEPAEQSVRVRN